MALPYPRLLLGLLLLAGAGCAVVNSPVVSDSRRVTKVARQEGRSISVSRLGFSSPTGGTRRIAFPSGVYPLEAEDAAFWYFRAPAPLQFSTISDENWMPPMQMGGLMIAKSATSPFTGGGYIDGSFSSKTIVWKLGGELTALEGKAWKRNF